MSTTSYLASEPGYFSIRWERADTLPVLVVEGEVDLVTAPQLGGAIEPFGPGEALVVDLCEVEFMDSTGLRELLRASVVLGDGLHVVCDPAGPVQRLFDVAAADHVLDHVHPSRAEALLAAHEH